MDAFLKIFSLKTEVDDLLESHLALGGWEEVTNDLTLMFSECAGLPRLSAGACTSTLTLAILGSELDFIPVIIRRCFGDRASMILKEIYNR